MAITIANNAINDVIGATLTVTITINAGDTVLVNVNSFSTNPVVKDNNGVTYPVLIASPATNGFVQCGVTNAAAATSIVVTQTSNPVEVSVFRYSGVSAFGNTATATDNGSQHFTPVISCSIQNANNWIVGNFFDNFNDGPYSAITGNLRYSGAANNQASLSMTVGDNTSGSVGSVTIGYTTTSSNASWIATAVELIGLSTGPIFMLGHT